jgi:uncharacterized membrane protein
MPNPLMEKEQQIKQLQEKINRLSEHVHLFQQELKALQAELDALNGKDAAVGNDTFSPTSFPRQEVTAGSDTGLENYIGFRFMHIIGIVVLVIGLSIGVKYAIDKELISESMRILLAYAAGVALYMLSWWLKKKYQLFSAILFSGSMASIYFTTYAAFVYYHFFPAYIAFAVMTALTVYTVIAAINYNRQEIAVLGMVGAYGIPFLVSANAERVDLFFSYILLINAGVAFISFRRSWKLMQYLALLITWLLFIGWSFMRYDPSTRVMGVVFMTAYYLLFLVSAIAPRIGRSTALLPGQIQQVLINNTALYISSLLLFGNGGFEMNMAATTGIIFLLIGLLALVAVALFPAELVLQRLLAWQAIVLLVLFIGTQWEGLAVTLLWIAVAVLLFVWGIINKRSWPRLAAIVLIGITLGKLIIFDSASFSTIQKIISFLVIGVLLLLFSFYYQKFNLTNKETGREK